MSTVVPAFRGMFGSTEYFILTMNVGDFTKKVTVPKELEGWEDLTPEEKFQREIDYRRVQKHIAPYLAHDKDRFIGAFIVEVRNDENMEFDTLEGAGIKFPKHLGSDFASSYGMLIFSGKEVLVPLDGQHRLAALDFAISGKNEKREDIKDLTPDLSLAAETVTVMLVRHDLQKSRKIFNKVNKNAKATSKADNLITDDDNYIAVICREEIIGDVIPSRLVRSDKGNTLSKKAPEFTTISTVFEISYKVEETLREKKPDLTRLPSRDDVLLSTKNIKDFWENFLEIAPYPICLQDPNESGDSRRADLREGSLVCKPIVQVVLANVLLTLQYDGDPEYRMGHEEVIRRINSLDWSPSNEMWQGVLLVGDKIIAGSSPRNFAARFVSYLLGQTLEIEEIAKLKESYRSSFRKELPPAVYS